MDRRGRRLGFLTAVLLVLVAEGIRGAPPVAGLRVLAAEKEVDGQTPGQKARSQRRASNPEVGPSNASSELQKNDPVPRNSPPPGGPSNPLPAPPAASDPPPTLDKAPPHTPGSGSLPNPSPTSGSPSHPPPAPGKLLNPSPSSLNGPPSSSGSPLTPSSSGVSSPSPSGNHPPPPESRIPGSLPNGKDGKDKTNKNETGSKSGSVGKDKENDKKKKETSSFSGSDDSQGKIQEMDKCKASMPIKCNAAKLAACVLQPHNVSQEWYLLLQNEGESPLNVNVSAPASMNIDKSFQIPKGKVSKVKINVNAAKDVRVVLNAGNGNCILRAPSSAGNFFQQFPSYSSYVTPIYGAYIVSLSVVLAGGTWACCKFRKRGRRVDGVPYQQLEMGTQHQSGALVDENVTEGWDDDWNDDWDEEEEVPRLPEKPGCASENGVAFRSTEKNEWEDWDD